MSDRLDKAKASFMDLTNDERVDFIAGCQLITPNQPQCRYEKVTESKLSNLVIEYENGGEFYFGNEKPMNIYAVMDAYRHDDPIYRRIELTPEELREKELYKNKQAIIEILMDKIHFNNSDLPATIASILVDNGFMQSKS